MKKTFLALLAVLLLAITVSAAPAEEVTNAQAADKLSDLGLFQGAGTLASGRANMALADPLTREQGVVLLVRLLGKETEAMQEQGSSPFSDVSFWAVPYVNYAVKNALAGGVSAKSFQGKAPIDAPQFVTFILRALGYEEGADFAWNDPWELSDSLGLTAGRFRDGAAFNRGGAAYISWKALNTAPRGRSETLLEGFLADGTVKRTTDATLAVCGDILPHMSVVQDAQMGGGDYSFSRILAGGASRVAGADYAVTNLETTLAAGSYTGYPCFRSPDALAQDLKSMGFDLLMTSNNHCLDSGYSGLARTLDVLDKAGLPHVGTSRSSYEREHNVRVADVGGISVAFLAYTYGTNGIAKPGDKPWSVNTFNTDYLSNCLKLDEATIRKDMDAAKALGTDLIAVMIHWGVEYQTKQNSYQEKVADFLIRNGADMVLGGHPHVLQPMEMRTAKDENGEEHRGFVCYSLGNYISSQTRRYTDVTAVLTLELTRDNLTGDTQVKDWTYAPMRMINLGTVQNRYQLMDARAAESSAWVRTKLNAAVQDCHDILGAAHDIANRKT